MTEHSVLHTPVPAAASGQPFSTLRARSARPVRRIAGLLALAAVLLCAPALPAGETVLQIDPARTTVAYKVDTTLHTVHGTFRLKSGTMRFDPANGAAAGELVVDAASGNSGSDARDQRMQKVVLESARFSEIVFRPNRIEGKVEREGASQVVIHGVFAIHGGEHEVAVPAEVQASGGQFSVVAHFAVPYVKWGMKNPGNFLLHVNDQVEITVQTVAVPGHETSRSAP